MDNDIHYIRKELDRLQWKLSDFTVTTYYATGTDDVTIPTTGWSTTKPSGGSGVFIWVRNTIHTPFGDLNLMPFCLGDGVAHIISITNYYLATSSAFDVPVPYPQNTNWQTTAPTLTTGDYMWTMQKIDTSQGSQYTSPVRITGEKGEKGADGLSIKGEDGKDGTSQYLHIRYSDLNNPTTTSHVFTEPNRFLGMYIDTTMETQANKSTYDNPALYSWRLFKPTAGIDYDDKFLHMKYASSVTFTGDTVTNIVYTGNDGEDAGDWLGVLFDTNSQDPQIYSSGTTVDYTVANSFSWTKITGEDGSDGSDGVDGNGVEMVYALTSTSDYNDLTESYIPPTTPTASTTIVDADGLNTFESGVWYDAPPRTDIGLEICWVSKRIQTEGVWGNYTAPIIHNFRKDGLDGKDGKDGRDASDLTTEDIMQMISGQSIDAQSIGGISFENIMTTNVQQLPVKDSDNHGHYTVSKIGKLCLVNFVNFYYHVESVTSDHYAFDYLPTWAYPQDTMYIRSINNNIISLSTTGAIRVNPNGVPVGTLISITGFFVYIANDNITLTPTSLSFVSNSVTTSYPLEVVLKDSNNKVIENTPIEFKVGGNTYTKQTDEYGVASLNLNFDAGTYPVKAEFKANQVYASSNTGQVNITVSKASNPRFLSVSDENKVRLVNTISNVDTPLRWVALKVEIDGDTHYQSTDGDGYFDYSNILANYLSSQTYSMKISVNNTNRCNAIDITKSVNGTKTIQTYTKTLSPNAFYVGSGTRDWDNLNENSIKAKNDGTYAKAYNIAYGNTYKEITMDCYGEDNSTGFNIPTGAVVKEIVVSMRYASLLGQTTMSKGSFPAPIFQLRVAGATRWGGDYRIGRDMSRTQCGEWRDEQVWIGIEESDGLQVGDKWNVVGLHINSAMNGGGGYGNNASFGFDYIAITITYEA